MENIEQSKEITTVEKIRKAVDDSPKKIQEEIERSSNRWLACLITRASVIDSYLNVGKRTGEINPENYQISKSKLGSLVEKIRNMQRQHNIKEDISDEIKNELITELEETVENL